MSREIKFNESKDEIVKCHCLRCNNDTNHDILLNVKIDEDEEIDDRYSISWYDDYQIVMCRGCNTTSFKQISFFSEDWNPDHNGKTEYHYPIRKIKIPLEISNMPYELYQLYNEVVNTYNAGALILVAGGLRAIIESICKVKGIDRGNVPVDTNGTVTMKIKQNLEGKIFGLQEAGYISMKQIDVLHELRFLGNLSLHEIETPKKQQIDIAFKIIESILELVFGIEEKSKKLRIFRENRV